MARRDTWTEQQLALDDERRDAIDRIHGRCKRAGITKSSDVVRAITDGLETEMRPLVEVELADAKLDTIPRADLTDNELLAYRRLKPLDADRVRQVVRESIHDTIGGPVAEVFGSARILAADVDGIAARVAAQLAGAVVDTVVGTQKELTRDEIANTIEVWSSDLETSEAIRIRALLNSALAGGSAERPGAFAENEVRTLAREAIHSVIGGPIGLHGRAYLENSDVDALVDRLAEKLACSGGRP